MKLTKKEKQKIIKNLKKVEDKILSRIEDRMKVIAASENPSDF